MPQPAAEARPVFRKPGTRGALVLAGVLGAFLLGPWLLSFAILPPCLLKPVTGVPCPGVGSTRDGLASILDTYRTQGIRRLVARRGDLPSGTATSGEFRYASELIGFIREREGGDWRIDVAAYPEYHPQTRYAKDEVMRFKRKVDAGANSAITQYFYNADAYFRFVDDCEAAGINVPIVPGVMPIGNFFQMARFSEACGAEIPRWMRLKFEGYHDDVASIRAFGLDVVTALCDRLLSSGAPGLHFYTLNQAGLTSTIWQRLGL